MKILISFLTLFICLNSFAVELVPEEVSCPVYNLKDEGTGFDTSLQSLFGGDPDYANLEINRTNNSVVIGYYGWSYPQDRPEFKVSVKTSGYLAIADINGPDNKNYIMIYNASNGCIQFNHAFKNIMGNLESGNTIAEGRCTKNSDNFDYEKIKRSDMNVCWRQPNISL